MMSDYQFRHTQNSLPTPPPPTFVDNQEAQSEDMSDIPLSLDNFSILHFNCQNSIQFTHEALTYTNYTLLSLQEPWFNTHTLNFPHHEAWHRISAYDYHPTTWSDRPRVCFYLSKLIPTSHFSLLPSSSDIILALEIKDQTRNLTKLRVISWYNPPGSLRGIMTLEQWLNSNHNRHIPSIIATDSNLHHQIWNPPGYTITDSLAKRLVNCLASLGFKLSSPKGIPTRFSTGTHSTTIDLIWSSWNITQKILSCNVLTNTLASDHFPIATILDLNILPAIKTHISLNISDIQPDLLHRKISSKLHLLPRIYSDSVNIDSAVTTLSSIILEAAQDQGKRVKTKLNKYKAWWDKDKLNPILKHRNQARKWMIKSNSPEARACYQEWQNFFREQVLKSKISHWKSFLANCLGNDTFKAFRYVKPKSTDDIAPLKLSDGSIATSKEDQAKALYYGTSVAHIDAKIEDIPQNLENLIQSYPRTFPILKGPELKRIINDLPNRRANGEDCISNEIIKLALPAIEDELCRLFNACFELGYFPNAWRKAVTIIIRKNGKDNYSDPGAYRPIALLSCLGKILEKIITNRLTYWAETSKIVALGHMGGRRHHSTDDALLILTTWIRERWRDNKVVSALSLDVKSAYPSVHRERLWWRLHEHKCPTYLLCLIHGFLTERSTHLRLQDYVSNKFDVANGLPQGSPLSVILYIIYNSPLLTSSPPDPKASALSLGFIDDVIHVVASNTFEENLIELNTYAKSSLEWGLSHGAIFDRKKAQLIHFTNKRNQALPSFHFGDVTLQPKQEIKWLGIWFDSKLLFNSHLQHIKKIGNHTLYQLRRLNKCYSGLSPKEIRKLVTSILMPRILYGSLIWFTARNFQKVNKMLTSFQNATLNLILGAFKGSSIDLLYHDAYITPFFLTVTRRHHNFYLKRLAAPDSHPTKSFILYELHQSVSKHKSPIQDMIDIDFFRKLSNRKIEIIYPHSFPPWTKTLDALHNLGRNKDEVIDLVPKQVRDEEERGSLVIFTDGSISSEGGGATAVSMQSQELCAIKNFQHVSNHEAELLGILLAAKLAKKSLRTCIARTPDIAIFGDNQGALSLINDIPRASSGQHIIIRTLSLFRQLPEDSTIRLYWTPGHAGIELNEKADDLAKQAATDQSGQTEVFYLPASLGSLKRRTKSKFSLKHFPLKPGRKPFKTNPKDISDALMNMEKGRTAAITQLRAGHSPLNDHLHKRNLTDSPFCITCKRKETTEHFLLFCNRYKKERRRFRSRLLEENIRVNWNDAKKLMDSPKAFFLLSEYILETKRFSFFHSYRQDTSKVKRSRNRSRNVRDPHLPT